MCCDTVVAMDDRNSASTKGKSITKQSQVFLSLEDERHFTDCLKHSIVDVKFINDSVWETPLPVDSESISNCHSHLAYLYAGQFQDLPSRQRPSGDYAGPASGCVVQVLRCRLKEGVLYSGTVSTGYRDGDLRMHQFVTRVWKCLKALGKIGVVGPTGLINRMYLVGNDANRLVQAGSIRLADRPTKIPFLPLHL